MRRNGARAENDPAISGSDFVFRATYCGNVLVAVQPDRGRRADRVAEYHDPRRSPRHGYVAFYLWLRQAARCDALIHMGAHGTLEWLPGKSIALSSACWPDALLGPTPVIYPFIVNNPGEAAAAKRRLGAVTIGHMTPPLSAGVLPKGLQAIERLLDEYSVADGLDPRRRERLAQAILEAARESGLDRDSGLAEAMTPLESVVRLDSFVCDVKDTLVADGLHIFGRVPLQPAEGIMEIPFEACAAGERAALLAALDGRHVAPGPAGSPWRGRRDVLPTGRNLFTVDTRAVPSRIATEQGKGLADALLTRHLQDHGDYPRHVMLDLWGSATMRTAGEEFAMALQLMGIAPVWDTTSDRVTGFDVITLAMLGRPRIDVTLRISGLFRDVFPTLPVLFEQAAAALAARDEPDEENPYRAADGPRVFGPAPGDYGVGVTDAVTEFTPATSDDAGEAWLAGSAFAYGGGDDGVAARPALERRTAATDAFVHPQDLPETDLLSAPDYAAHEAGFAAAAGKLTGAAPTLYHADSTTPDAPRMRTLTEEIARVVRGRAANPRWIAGQMRHGFRGAAEIAATLDQMATFAHLAGAVESHHFDLYYDATLGDDAVRRFIEQANPEAANMMRRRFQQMLDAGYWTTRRNSAIEAIAIGAGCRGRVMSYAYETDGAAIYRRSFAIIRAEARLDRFEAGDEKVAVRIIHASGMVDVADDIVFTPGFSAAASSALRAGAPIFCDAQMVAHGITRARLPADNAVNCTLSDPRVPALAASLRTTRSAAALELWREQLAGSVVVIGNAPTALFRLLEILQEPGVMPPAAVIGIPVGFVGAEESKQALVESLMVPSVIVRGRRGGSAMAAAALNAVASETE